MGRKCGVDGCLSDSNRPEDVGVTFHKVPMHTDIRPKWISLCRIPGEKKNVKVIYVCSRHFLRADFCNFKGKKYMLRQGVFPSVFPWDKSKLEAIKAETSDIKNESDSFSCNVNIDTDDSNLDIDQIKSELEMKQEMTDDLSTRYSTGYTPVTPVAIDFSINSRIEALDFNNLWYPARIVEIDYEENEVLIHFEKFSSKYDEWICMDSPRLRALSLEKPNVTAAEKYEVGERCLAFWSDDRNFPATVTRILENDSYEVLFDDGYVKTIKSQRMVKSQGKHLQSAPLFDPIKSTKQERRDKKRKLNVAALFGKRQRTDNSEEKSKISSPRPRISVPESLLSPTEEESDRWFPQWVNGKPVGTESTIESNDGLKKSTVVLDPRLPPDWTKHILQRSHGASAGKWDIIIVSPDNRRFRTRAEVKHYLEETKLMKYNEQMFDFGLHKQKLRKTASKTVESKILTEPRSSTPSISGPSLAEQSREEEANINYLKIPIVDDAYKCPIEGCGKTFRRENLAQMHVKHYHPEFTKFLDSTPNVADLAYARTVGESLDKSPAPPKPTVQKSVKTSTPKIIQKQPQSPIAEIDAKPLSPLTSKGKDSEIIKLLNTKPFDSKNENEPLPSGLPPDMYPDIKLRDLLNKSEGIPKREDLNLRTLSTTRPPTGIKTLLPVIRNTENKSEDASDGKSPKHLKHTMRRKWGPSSEQPETLKPREVKVEVTTTLPPPPEEAPPIEPNNVIIEGGQVIKIVRMKQEEIINCTCGFTEEDGLMIQCELCLCWQHAYCNNIERESQVPEKYICYICQNPLRQRSSRKYYNDQDWLKQGTLPTASYHTKDEEMLQKKFEKLKKSHDISGGIVELQDFVNTLKIKLKVAQAQNHPKLYLWSKPWDKLPLPEKMDLKVDTSEVPDKSVAPNDPMLMMILKNEKDTSDNLMDTSETQSEAPIIPQPEAPIESADCRLNLLDHIIHSQNLVMERLDDFEKQIDQLEEGYTMEKDENYPCTRQTIQMLMRDLNKLEELSQNTSI